MFFLFWTIGIGAGGADAIEVLDDVGNKISFDSAPQKVVCLSPSATEIIFAINAQAALCGITYHSSHLPGAAGKTIVGGFSAPSADRVSLLGPDLVILTSLQRDLAAQLRGNIPTMVIETRHMQDAFAHIRLMGTLFQQEAAAAAIIERNQRQLELVARKVAQIPPEKRKRVMRLMGSKEIMTPGRDSFQNEMIRAAGGIAPDLEKAAMW